MNYLELIKIIKNRRTIRFFEDKEVPEELIKILIDAGRWAPSACNLQHWLFISIKNKDLKEKIQKKGKVQSQIIKAPLLLAIFCDKNSSKQNYANIQSTAAAIMNISLVAETLNLGTTWICGFEKGKNIRKLLNVPKKYEIIAFLSIGYPKKNFKPSAPPRAEVEKILFKEGYDPKKGISYPDNINIKNWTTKEVLEYQKRISRRGFKFEDIPSKKVKIICEKINLQNKKILDYNSFSGIFLSELQKNNSLIIDGQFLTKEVKEAALIYNKELKNKNLLYTKKNKSYEIITLFYRLEHTPESINLFKDFHKTLKEDGELIIVTRNKYSWRGLLNYYQFKIRHKTKIQDRFFQGLHHMGPIKFYSQREIKKIMYKSGFKKINIAGLFITPLYELTTTITYKNNKKLRIIEKCFKTIEKISQRLNLNDYFGETLIIRAKK